MSRCQSSSCNMGGCVCMWVTVYSYYYCYCYYYNKTTISLNDDNINTMCVRNIRKRFGNHLSLILRLSFCVCLCFPYVSFCVLFNGVSYSFIVDFDAFIKDGMHSVWGVYLQYFCNDNNKSMGYVIKGNAFWQQNMHSIVVRSSYHLLSFFSIVFISEMVMGARRLLIMLECFFV